MHKVVLTCGLWFDKRTLQWITLEATRYDENNLPSCWAIRTSGGILINKQRILTRDFNIPKYEIDFFRLMDRKEVEYIDKQYRQYENIIRRIKTRGYKYQIIKT